MWMNFSIVSEHARMMRYKLSQRLSESKDGRVSGGGKTWTNGDSHDRVDGEY